MKAFILLAATTLAPVSMCRALTETEITAAALIGKTLTFQATNGTGLLPTSGTWTGKFETNANRDFSITNQGGIVSDYSSRFTAIGAGGPTIFSLTSIYQNSGTTTLTLTLSGTQGLYTLSCFFFDTSGGTPTPITATQGGTFTVAGAVVDSPEIDVREDGVKLADGKAKSDFGSVKTGRKSGAKTYKITNKGKASLKNIKVTTGGTKPGDFLITKPTAASLAPGKSTSFTVTFKPTGKGIRNAALKIASNDANENPFDVKLTGVGN